MKFSKVIIIIIIIIFILALLVWLYMVSTKPLPGIEALQDGRDHLPEGTKIDYKSNPPTSGNHYPSWISKGFYDEPRSDGNLVHSLEHGYVIFWYDCERKVTLQNVILRRLAEGSVANATLKQVEYARERFFASLRMTEVYAQAGMTAGSEGSPSAKLSDMPASFSDGSCDNLKNQIKDQIKKNNPYKLIAVPRIDMDSPLILTAWGRMEKFNSVDGQKLKDFIDASRDHGPEHTVED